MRIQVIGNVKPDGNLNLILSYYDALPSGIHFIVILKGSGHSLLFLLQGKYREGLPNNLFLWVSQDFSRRFVEIGNPFLCIYENEAAANALDEAFGKSPELLNLLGQPLHIQLHGP